jgi:hypothetical protein
MVCTVVSEQDPNVDEEGSKEEQTGVFAAEAGYGLGRRAGEGEDDEGRRRTGRSAQRC